jgi:hypothetical protein
LVVDNTLVKVRDELHELAAVWLGATAADLEILRSFAEHPVPGTRNFFGEEFETADVPQVA